MKEKLTPMLEQYLRIKKQYPDVILFFRLGDFYEMFFEDAKLASSLLHIALTSREAGGGKRIPMCGVPHHAAENYIARLLKEGHKVAVCEQVEDPKLARGIVKREVIRVITPGTLVSESLIEEANNYIVAINEEAGKFGLAFCDISTAEFKTTQLENRGEMLSELTRLNPSECLIPEERIDLREMLNLKTVTPYPEINFLSEVAYEYLLSCFRVSTLAGFGLDGKRLAISCSGALLRYLEETQKRTLEHIKKLEFYSLENFMLLDAFTQRSLELIRNLETSSKRGSLFWVLDRTLTSMGKRGLERWILQPLIQLNEICLRQQSLDWLYQEKFKRREIQEILKGLPDLERISAKIGLALANPRDLILLKESLARIRRLKEVLQDVQPELLKNCVLQLDPLEEVQELLESALVDEPPVQINEGNLIKAGFSAQLDELREIARSGKSWIAELQAREIKRSGINSLKVGYNKVFGYYIEVSKPNLKYVPSDYIRKQTLLNAERFITPELKEYEEKVLGAEERIKELEKELFLKIRDELKKSLLSIQANAQAITVIDILQSLAEVAEENRYVKPRISSNYRIYIKEGRHPVLEKILGSGSFIPNDLLLEEERRILLVTGPNMAGKSTYIRQIALIVIMAQMGSFVPAESAEIGIVDRIFTRIGARDFLGSGMSTFMVEMVEVARILNQASSRSLIILDEVGRGTSTYDGLSIAWAVVEYIQKKIKAKTLFATHYHELTQISRYLPEVKNVNVAVREYKGEVIFLYRIEEGSSDRSFGIHVAQLAGVPTEVTQRAGEILNQLEQGASYIRPKMKELQLEMFSPARDPLLEEIKKLELEKISPLEALNLLSQFQKKLNSREKS